MTNFKPLVPEDLLKRASPTDCLVRAIVASARACRANTDPAEAVRKIYPEDRAAQFLVTRAASSPATTFTSGWVDKLVSTINSDLITTLGPASAASGLLNSGAILVNWNGNGQVMVPALVSAAANAGFVQEGSPIPIRLDTIGGTTLAPRKFASGFAITREVAEMSTPSAEALIRAALRETVGAALDKAMLDSTTADATRPAGLLAGLTTLAASTLTGDAALAEDLGTLANAIAATAGLQVAFIASPGEAVKIALWAGPKFTFPVFASSGLAAGVVTAVAIPALAAAVDATPEFSVTEEATFHMDSSPSPISTVATPNLISAPARNLFQTDCIGIKVILRVAWGLRATGSVAFVQSVNW